MNDFLSSNFWSQRYKDEQTGWDLGKVSPPIKEYVDQLRDKELKILIPGCGCGYEGEYLFRLGFKHVHLLDFSPEPLDLFKNRNPDFTEDHLHIGDFFEHEGSYDLILEQTLFCAIDPKLRMKYAEQTAKLLKPGGKLVGLFFNREFESSPPFGGNSEEYKTYFQTYFREISMEECYNSVEPRRGTELFVKMLK